MRPPHVNAQAVIESLRLADLLKLNQDELTDIQGRLTGPQGASDFIPWLMGKFAISAVALTRGSRGSSFFSRDGQISSSAILEADVIDTVGAGDGFAAILAAGYLRGLAWEDTLARASRFAARICRIPGAIPDDNAFYDDFRSLGKGYADDR
jgi:fructokinase